MILRLLFAGLLFTILSACHNNPHDVDISNVEIEMPELIRLDKELAAIDISNLPVKTTSLNTQLGAFYDHFLMGFLVREGSKDTAYSKQILSFVGDADVRSAIKDIDKIYTSDQLEQTLSEFEPMVKRFHYHFPNKAVPKKLVTTITGWNYAIAYFDTTLVIGLDMYLGDTSRFYQMLRYPQYQVRKMKPEYIMPDLARGWLLTEFDNSQAENNLLAHTIFYGKLFFAVNALLPEAHDSLIIGYTAKQLQYCKEYEKKLWGYFAEKNRLFENNLNTVRELTTDGPFTGAISKECPPRIAMWVGWQIVKSYMEKNPKISLAELMRDQDAKSILNKSKYRP